MSARLDTIAVAGTPSPKVHSAGLAQHLAIALRGYLLAMVCVLGCLGLRWWLDPILGNQLPFQFLLIPIVLSAWRIGLGPSLFSMGLGLVLVFWFFIEPRHQLGTPNLAAWVAIGGYLVTGSLICWFGDRVRRSNHRLAKSAETIRAKQESLEAEIAVRRQAEAKSAEAEHRFRTLTEAIPQLVWTASPDGSVDYTSSQFKAFSGLPMEEGLGEKWLQLLHPDDRAAAQAAWKQAVQSGQTADYEVRLRGQDGNYYWFKNRAVPLRDTEDRIVQWFGTATEISAIVEARAALRRSHQELEQVVQERTAELEALKNKIHEENAYLRQNCRIDSGDGRLVGGSGAMQHIRAQVDQVAATDSTVLLLGETGTGKGRLAASIHERSPRQGRTLVTVNCAAMPGPLVESELFGREKGAFTGSLTRQVGRFELADRSTIFLDEIGELSLEVQAKLLRVLEEKQIERLGNPKPIRVDVRILAATNRDLNCAMAEGRFREDLYYRLNVFPIMVPPLRERREDITPLVWAFVDEFARTFNKNIQSIDAESMGTLLRYSWPGNIRELRNVIERAMIIASGPKLHVQLPEEHPAPARASGHRLEEVERDHVLSVLEESGWRIRGANGAAEKLGLKPTTLEARLAKMGIRRPGAVSRV